jgi:tetratricopeptide (TPR) repeat protein
MNRPRRLARTRTFLTLAAMAGAGAPVWARAASPPAPVQPAPQAAAPSGAPFASLEVAYGGVTVVRLGQAQPGTAAMPLQVGDVVMTRRGLATVRFHADGSVLRIGPDSRVQVSETARERDVTVFLGRLWAHVVRWKERPTRFSSAGTIAAIRGTELVLALEADGEQTQISVLEGQVRAENEAGGLDLRGGQAATARRGRAPAVSAQVRPRDAVRWALYYPPVLSLQPADLGEASGWQRSVRASLEAHGQGDLERALGSLEGLDTAAIRDPRFFDYRASLLLAAGAAEEAGRDLERALALSPNDSHALALQAIMAVVNNQADRALATAQRAVAADRASATAQVALSYARQARFDLEGAREALETAVTLDAGNALAWARLAEMRSSLGHLGAALQAARKSAQLQPGLARAQTVLGFTYLTQVRTRQAREALARAVELDPSDPLPRLGLGLARIREGDLDGGIRELEIAVSLDPGQPLVRSYLGKAYFEAKREDLVGREYDLAKESDPQDPTPWLYHALFRQTTNDPVGALGDLRDAIEKNDNRAVYRSRLLLDSDLASRSASLGRVYADLGFQNLALVEGWSSVNTDPGNYSAHRLLADSYAARPRHEVARVSELFQSQMLQPLNTTPIQPSLGESSLFLISAQGPAALAFNEFNPLFNRDQLNVQGSFLAGEDGTFSGEGILSGIYRKLSFSAGFSGFSTDGFRPNNTQDDRIGTVFVQAELGPRTSVQAEGRYRKREQGDLAVRFFEGDFELLEEETTESKTGRVGLRHDFGPDFTALASYMRQDKDIDFALPDPDLGLDFSLGRDEKADSLEAQFLYRAPKVKVVGGAGRFDIDADEEIVVTIDDPFFGLTDRTASETAVDHTNLYAYSYLSPAPNLTFTLGVSGDLFDEGGTAFTTTAFAGLPPDAPVEVEAQVLGSRDQLNPKVGALFTAASGTTLRAAWFKTLKRTLVTDQTLEPTQVAGFNQFFDDPSATRATVWGGAIDQKFGKKAFGGFEFYERDLRIPQTVLDFDVGTREVALRDGEERQARVYLFAAPHDRLTLSAEYLYEDVELDEQLFFPYRRVKSHWVPLSARFFHPSGIGASLTATLLKQEGDFKVPDEDRFVPGERDFWILDAAVRYRLPRRYGFLVAGVNNLTDERSPYQATDARNLRFRPGRSFYFRAVVAFP